MKGINTLLYNHSRQFSTIHYTMSIINNYKCTYWCYTVFLQVQKAVKFIYLARYQRCSATHQPRKHNPSAMAIIDYFHLVSYSRITPGKCPLRWLRKRDQCAACPAGRGEPEVSCSHIQLPGQSHPAPRRFNFKVWWLGDDWGMTGSTIDFLK